MFKEKRLIATIIMSLLGPLSLGLFVLRSGMFRGAGVGQQMLCGFSALWHVGQGVGSCSGIGSGGGHCCIVGGGSTGWDSGCIRVWSWLLLLAW